MATNTKTDPREMPGYALIEAAHYLRIPHVPDRNSSVRVAGDSRLGGASGALDFFFDEEI